MIYKGEFSCWSDITSAFQCDCTEPEEVLFAEYETPSYEGYATVVFRAGEKFYVVEGSHCSCYGLEGQWQPEEYERGIFIETLRRRNEDWAREIANQLSGT